VGSVSAGQSTSVVDGITSTGEQVGQYNSQLQAFIDSRFAKITPEDLKKHSFFNSTVLRYLNLTGDYLADQPLQIPSMFVLRLAGTMAPAANLSTHNVSRFTGMLQLKNVHYSAVIGGTYDASSLPAVVGSQGYQAITIVGGGNNAIRGVRAIANHTGSALGVNMASHNEISDCDVGGSPEANVTGRCIWCLASSHNLVHDNYVHHCKAHALDFDAYTSYSVAYNNLCEFNGEEGIFVEETASYNVVTNNTCRKNGAGISLYANAVGPVSNNFIINNLVTDNVGNGLSTGGYGHNPKKISLSNTIAGNRVVDNGGHDGGQVNVHHGATTGDYWTANTFESDSGVPTGYSDAVGNSSSVAIFEP
jgi:parallel beta-helix repeat protein